MVQLPGTPMDFEEPIGREDLPTRLVLGSYEKGIHYVALNMFQLQVWALNEPADGQLGWTLTHKADLSPYNHRINHSSLPTETMVPWKAIESEKSTLSLFEPFSDYQQRYLDEQQSYLDKRKYGPERRRARTKLEKDVEYSWDSDEDNFINMGESTAHLYPPESYYYASYYRIIGLHPHKDVLLLHLCSKAAAYHLNTSRMQYLGKKLVRSVLHQCTLLYTGCGVKRAFPYRPCYIDALPTTKIPR